MPNTAPRNPRNLFNGDCTFLFTDVYAPRDGSPYTIVIIHRYIDMLADCGVDTYLACGNAQVPWYPSKAVPNILTGYKRGDRDFVAGAFPPCDAGFTPEMLQQRITTDVAFLNHYLDLAEAGVDWMKEIAQRCRQRGITPWATVRMNDMHGANNWDKAYLNSPPQRDPACRLRGTTINPKAPPEYTRQSLNYAHPKVRQFQWDMICELVEEYGFEGLELDWLRCAFCCDAPATQEHIGLATEFHARIRELTQKQAKKLGKPFPLTMRVPPRLGMAKGVGIDVVAIAKAGLIDAVAFSNGWQTSWDIPYDELRKELGPAVKVFGVVEAAPNWMHARNPRNGRQGYRLLPASPELMRGNAAGKLAMGVDGIEWFNFFAADESHHQGYEDGKLAYDAKGFQQRNLAGYGNIRGMEDLEALRGKPKQYALSSRMGNFMFSEFEQGEQVPCLIEPGWKQPFRLSMAAEPGSGVELTVQVVIERKAAPDLGVSFNGCWPNFAATLTEELLFPTGTYTHHVEGHQAFNFVLDAALIREGWNEVLVYNDNKKRSTPAEIADGTLRVVSVELAVRIRR